MPEITVLNVMKVIDVDRRSVSKQTFHYLDNFITYCDNKLREDLINLQNAQEDIDSDRDWIPNNEHTRVIEREVKALLKVAQKSDAAYVRFISISVKDKQE